MNQLLEKGFYIWKIPMCENGDPSAIAHVASQAGLSHVIIKIANGIYDYNYDSVAKRDLVKPVVLALKVKGIQVWGWHYVYGDLPKQEAAAAIRQIGKIPLDGYVINAESEYKDKYTPCRIFLSELRATLPDFPMSLSSFRYPKYHPQLPWKDFLSRVDLNMPQVYWEQAHNPAEQLQRCLNEFQSIAPFRTIIPTGPAYGANEWKPTSQDIIEFMNTAIQLNMPAINFYSWDYCRSKLPNIWGTISNFSWPNYPNASKDISEFLINALNIRDLDTIVSLYHSNAAHITAQSTIQGPTQIRAWYDLMINQLPVDFHYETTSVESNMSTRHIHWNTVSNAKIIKSGIDTIGLLNGKIIYHYSSMNE